MRTLPAAVDHDVRRLEIAMHDAPLVRGGEAGADLARDLERAVLRKAADAPEQRREILAVDVLHRQERVALDFVDVVDAADVRMRHLPRHPHFGVELREPRGIAIDRLGQEFQRDRLAELQVVGAIDLTHAALCRAADDAVAPAEEGAGREAAVIDRVLLDSQPLLDVSCLPKRDRIVGRVFGVAGPAVVIGRRARCA